MIFSSLTDTSTTQPSTNLLTNRLDSCTLWCDKTHRIHDYPLIPEGKKKRNAQARHLNMQKPFRENADQYGAYSQPTSTRCDFASNQKCNKHPQTPEYPVPSKWTIQPEKRIWEGRQVGHSHTKSDQPPKEEPSGIAKEGKLFFSSDIGAATKTRSNLYTARSVNNSVRGRVCFQVAATTVILLPKSTYKIPVKRGINCQNLHTHTCLHDTGVRLNLVYKAFIKHKWLFNI